MAACLKVQKASQASTLRLSLDAHSAVFKTASKALQAQTSPSASYLHEISTPAAPEIDFSDPQAAFATKTSRSLLKSLCTLQACRVKPLVHNASSLLKFSRACLGQRVTDSVVEATFFNHFCAGTNAETIKPTLAYLKQRGILPILNYAAEDDVKHDAKDEGLDMDGEACLNKNVGIFMRSIRDSDNTAGSRGFVGIKVTGLSQPILLERMSEVLAGAGSLLDRGHSSRDLEKLMAAYLNATEMKSFQNLWQRLDQLASAVYHKGNMRMLIDAEQTYLQPAIDALTIALQQKYNKNGAVIMNTYQCYLKCSAGRIEADMKRAADEGWVWGAKTVRGAYMHQERSRAQEMGYGSPIQDSLADTHNNYNSCVQYVLGQIAKGGPELMVASHNQASVEQALKAMQYHGLSQNNTGSGVYFGQLLGMADNLSFPLGANGYNVYKICAYGSVHQTIAFLLRRALENSDALGGVSTEIDMIKAELFRRANPLQKWQRQPAVEPSLQHA